MRTMRLGVAYAALALLPSCGGGNSAQPTPVTTPTPTPTPTQAATPSPSASLPPGLVCDPTPPPLYGLVVKVHNDLGNRKTLDSRPIVINVSDFCEKAGFAASARFCFTRREGDPQATACDYLAVGKASDTGRWGPTWSYDGKPCTAGPGEPGCSNHADNQFLLNTRGDGEYEACVASDIPLSQDPDVPGSRCGRCSIVNAQGCQ